MKIHHGFCGIASRAGAYVWCVSESKLKKGLILCLLGLISSTGGKLLAQCDLPVITGFSPTNGPIGTSVTINGSHFSTTISENAVWFGGVKAVVTDATENSLTVTVPAGTGNQLSVFTSCGMHQASDYFNLTSTGLASLSSESFTDPTYSYGFAIKNGSYTGIGLHSFSNLSYADFDTDGKLDAVLGRQGVYLQLNTTVTPGTLSEGIVVGNRIDGASFETRYYNGTGQNLVYEIPGYNTNNAQEGGIAFGDMNGDGKLDIVSCVYRPANTDRVVVHINNCSPGNVSFSSTSYPTGGKWARWVRVADFDNDGKLDVLVSTSGGGGCVFRNTTSGGSISFAAIQQLSLLDAESYLEVADLDKDGKVDIICRQWQGAVKVFRNTSTGVGNIGFSAANTLTVHTGGTWHFAVGDLDGDGKLDIAAPCADGKISILRNTSTSGTLSFDSYQNFTTNVALGTGFVSIGNLDGDALPDIAFVPNGDYKCFVAKNTTNGTSISFDTPINLNPSPDNNLPQYTAGVAIGDYDGDGDNDVATISQYTNGINYFSNGYTGSVTWTGAVSTDWSTPSNWSPAVVPTATIDAVVPSGLTNYPFVSATTNAQVKNLIHNGTGTERIVVARGGKLTVNGTFIAVNNSEIKQLGSP